MSTEVIEHLPVVRERSSVLLMPVMDVNTAMKRLEEFQTFCAHYLQESKDGGADGGDYGVIPGTKKKTLLKSGADKLCEVYGLYDEYIVMSSIEDWEKGLFDYTLKCVLKSRRDDSMVGSGVGSCSSWESKYRWREAKRKCPSCQKENIRKSNKPGEGWYCWRKTDGCGATFKEGDPAIESQVSGRVMNEDVADAKNTVLKMAKKRAKIDATIGVTRSSGIFTQDLEDLPMPAPTKPPVERTTEDIEIGGKTINNAVPADDSRARPSEGTDAPNIPGSDCIDEGQAANFHVEFKKALPAKPEHLRKQARDIAHDWLRMEKILDVLGQPSALAIKKDCFFDVRQKAIEYAKTYSI